jgi:hypothetical protein
MEQTTEIQELSLEKVIDSKLVQNNVTNAVLDALKTKYGGMKLKALDDKESYIEIKSAARDCAKVRTLTTKLCKEGRERAVKEQKLWIAKEKEIIAEVAIVEDALDAEIKKFDDEVERIANEEKERQEGVYINRQATLTKMGAVYNEGSFTLGASSFEAILIKNSSEEVWEEMMLPKFQAEYEKIESVRIEEERRKDEEAKELKRKQDELAENNRLFEEQKKEFERKQAEAKKLEEEKQHAEALEKEKQKSALQKKRFELIYPVNPIGSDMDMNTLWALSENDFNEKLEAKTKEFNEAKAEKDRLAEEKRLADIEEAKQKAIKDEQDRVAEKERLDEIKKKQEEEKRIAELESAGDKVKWELFIKKVNEIEVFEMRSGQYRRKMQIAKEKIEEILEL